MPSFFEGQVAQKPAPLFVGIIYEIIPTQLLTFLLVCIIINSTKHDFERSDNYVNSSVYKQKNGSGLDV